MVMDGWFLLVFSSCVGRCWLKMTVQWGDCIKL
jgi:hypothetical protein